MGDAHAGRRGRFRSQRKAEVCLRLPLRRRSRCRRPTRALLVLSARRAGPVESPARLPCDNKGRSPGGPREPARAWRSSTPIAGDAGAPTAWRGEGSPGETCPLGDNAAADHTPSDPWAALGGSVRRRRRNTNACHRRSRAWRATPAAGGAGTTRPAAEDSQLSRWPRQLPRVRESHDVAVQAASRGGVSPRGGLAQSAAGRWAAGLGSRPKTVR